jgi:hypothetical protein
VPGYRCESCGGSTLPEAAWYEDRGTRLRPLEQTCPACGARYRLSKWGLAAHRVSPTLLETIAQGIVPVVLTLGLLLIVVIPLHYLIIGLWPLLRPKLYKRIG